MDPVRVACVRYLNTAPLVEGLAKLEGCQLIPAVPSHIAGLVTRGEADVGLISIVDAVTAEPELALLPAGMIGCDGPTLTVRLFSSVPLNAITSIHADTDSHTSAILAQVVLHARHGIRPQMIDFDARERVARGQVAAVPAPALEHSWPTTILLIGDKVVTDAPSADRYPHQLDLGQAWKELTGLPFVYAMWACRRDRAETDVIRRAAELLDRQLRRNRARMDWIVQTRAPEHRWPIDLAAQYLGSYLRYSVGPRERQAVARFLQAAAELGLLPPRQPAWIDPAPALA